MGQASGSHRGRRQEKPWGRLVEVIEEGARKSHGGRLVEVIEEGARKSHGAG